MPVITVPKCSNEIWRDAESRIGGVGFDTARPAWLEAHAPASARGAGPNHHGAPIARHRSIPGHKRRHVLRHNSIPAALWRSADGSMGFMLALSAGRAEASTARIDDAIDGKLFSVPCLLMISSNRC